MSLRAITSLAALLVVACHPSDAPTSASRNDPHAAPIPLTRFTSDSTAFAQHSGVMQAENFVIRDPATWNDLWQQIHATVTPAPPLPVVDFSQEMVVASALGSKSSGGYNVLLTDAARDTVGVVVLVQVTNPGAHCAVTLALTQPIDIARLPRTDGAVRFAATQHSVDCGP